jgi:hypothetical protein
MLPRERKVAKAKGKEMAVERVRILPVERRKVVVAVSLAKVKVRAKGKAKEKAKVKEITYAGNVNRLITDVINALSTRNESPERRSKPTLILTGMLSGSAGLFRAMVMAAVRMLTVEQMMDGTTPKGEDGSHGHRRTRSRRSKLLRVLLHLRR